MKKSVARRNKSLAFGNKCLSVPEQNMGNIFCQTQTSQIAHSLIDQSNGDNLRIENVVGNFNQKDSSCDKVQKKRKKKKYYVFNIVINPDKATTTPPQNTSEPAITTSLENTSDPDKDSVDPIETQAQSLNLTEEVIQNIAIEVAKNVSALKKRIKENYNKNNSKISKIANLNTIPTSVEASVNGKEKNNLVLLENYKADTSLTSSPLELISESLPRTESKNDLSEIIKEKFRRLKKCNCGINLDTDDKLKNHKCFKCGWCKLYFQTLSEREQHKKVCNKPIPCKICGESVEMRNYSCHRANHRKKRNYTCLICNLSFEDKNELKKHRNECKSEKECKICGKLIKKGFSRHMAAHEKKQRNCIKCKVWFVSKRELDDHKVGCTGKEHRTYFKRPVVCEICGVIVKKRNYLSHKAAHENLKQYKCSLCVKSFNTAGKRYVHNKKVHRKKYLIYVCSFCGLKSQSKSHISEHEVIHKVPDGEPIPTKYACECGKAFVSKYELDRHTRNYHRPRKCLECREEFTGFYQLLNHRYMTHKPPADSKSSENPKRSGSNCEQKKSRIRVRRTAETCHLCDKVLSSHNSKVTHMMRYHHGAKITAVVVDHDGVRKTFEKTGDVFVCDVCGKHFARLKSFRGHVLLAHRPGRQFPCNLCQSRFKRVHDLTRHVKDNHSTTSANDEK